MVEKRGAEENGGEAGPDAKRSRTDGAKPALNLEALQKAKALLQKQKLLQEKLKKLPKVGGVGAAAGGAPSASALAATANPLAPGGVPAAAGVPGALDAALIAAKAAKAVEIASKFGVQASLASVPAIAAVAAAGGVPPRPLLVPVAGGGAGPRPLLAPVPGSAGPRPLRLDEWGREVDESGNVIQAARAPITNSLINQRRGDESALPAAPPSPPGPRDEDFVDHSMLAKHASRLGGGAGPRRRRGALEFVEEGVFARQAEIMRLKQKYGEADFKKHLPPHLRRPPRGPAGPAERDAAAGGDANQTPLGAPAIPGLAGAGGVEGLSDANMVPLGVRPVEVSEEDRLRAALPGMAAPPPDVEWWDKPLLDGGAYYAAPAAAGSDTAAAAAAAAAAADDDDEQQQPPQEAAGPDADAGGSQQQQQQKDNVIDRAPDGEVMRLRLGKISRYVEHPVLLEPPAAGPPPAPQPLKLTKRELKKMRTQRRQAREKEKQELMRQGLLEPPKPKVKISNLMRVLGEEATLDPTAIEQEVRRQMGERQAAHDDRNLSRMLTPAERRDKKLRKLLETGPGAGLTTQVSVYRVEQLTNGQQKFKVDMNARENHMSGMMLVCPAAFSLVVVEGGAKAIKRYHKLMLRRIDWQAGPLPPPGEEEAEDEAAQQQAAAEEEQDRPPNSCHLVWEGVVGAAAFRDFLKAEVASPEAARKLLADRGVGHYWDAAANFDFDAAPLVELP